MNVTEAVASRRSVRAFLDRPVDQAVLRRVLDNRATLAIGRQYPAVECASPDRRSAQRPARQGKAEVRHQRPPQHEPEYAIYPPGLDGRYEDQRFGIGKAMFLRSAPARQQDGAGRIAR